LTLVKEERIALADIKGICVHSSRLALDAAGKTAPVNGLEGKFSIPYCVANALLRSQTGIQAFTDDKVRDPSVRALMKKITVIHDPEMKALEAIVEIETKEGKVYKHFSDILQQIPPLTVKQNRVRSKFMDLVGPILGKKKAQKLADTVAEMERVDNMRLLTEDLLQ
jgi:2-methylcitrate dehydratase PrpD